MQPDMVRCKRFSGKRQELSGNRSMDQQAFSRITNRNALAFCIFEDSSSLGKVGAFIYINMAVARTGFNDRYRSVFDNGARSEERRVGKECL